MKFCDKYMVRKVNNLTKWTTWVLALLCGVAHAQDSGPVQITIGLQFRIAGTLVSATTAAPLAQAKVSIFDVKTPNAARTTVTAADGRFEFSQLAAGKYSLQGARRGFIGAAYDQHEQYSTAIVTGAGVDTENLVLRLSPAAVLSGTVRDESAEPVDRAMVALFREDHSGGVSRVVQVNGTTTDDQGSYEFTRLAAGIYFVSVTAKPWYAMHSVADEGVSDSPPAVDRNLDVAYPTTYYPDATDTDQAVPVPLKGGDHVQIEIRLSPVPALRLRYRMTAGEPTFAMPMFSKRAFDSRQPVDHALEISEGVYYLTGIPAGHYNVRVDGSNGRVERELDLVDDGQEIDASNGESLSRVTAAIQVAGQKDPPSDIRVGLMDSHRNVVGNEGIDAKGQVHFEDVSPGKYTVLAWGQNKAYAVGRISWPGSEITGHELTVAAGASLDISVALLTGTADVEGIATRAGKGMAGAMVVLVPEGSDAHWELFRRDQSDLDGTFRLRAVVAGTYTVIAIENGWDLDWSQPAVLRQYIGHGQTIKVGGQPSIHVPAPVEIQAR